MIKRHCNNFFFIISTLLLININSNILNLSIQTQDSNWVATTPFTLKISSQTEPILANSPITFQYKTNPTLDYPWLLPDPFDHDAPESITFDDDEHVAFCYIEPAVVNQESITELSNTNSTCDRDGFDLGRLLRLNPNQTYHGSDVGLGSFLLHVGKFELINSKIQFSSHVTIPPLQDVICKGRLGLYSETMIVNQDQEIQLLTPSTWSLSSTFTIRPILSITGAYPIYRLTDGFDYQSQRNKWHPTHQFDTLRVYLTPRALPRNVISKVRISYATTPDPAIEPSEWNYNELIQTELNHFYHYTQVQQGQKTNNDGESVHDQLKFNCGKDVRLWIPMFGLKTFNPRQNNPNFHSEDSNKVYYKYNMYFITGDEPMPDFCEVPINRWLVLRERFLFRNWLTTETERKSLKFGDILKGFIQFEDLGEGTFFMGKDEIINDPRLDQSQTLKQYHLNFQQTRVIWRKQYEPIFIDQNKKILQITTKIRSSLPSSIQLFILTDVEAMTEAYHSSHVDCSKSYIQEDPDEVDPTKGVALDLEQYWVLELDVSKVSHFLEIVLICQVSVDPITSLSNEIVDSINDEMTVLSQMISSKYQEVEGDFILGQKHKNPKKTPMVIPKSKPYRALSTSFNPQDDVMTPQPFSPFLFSYELASIYNGVIQFLPKFRYTPNSARYIDLYDGGISDPIKPSLSITFSTHFELPTPILTKSDYQDRVFFHEMNVQFLSVGMNYLSTPFSESESAGKGEVNYQCVVKHFDSNGLEIIRFNSITSIQPCRIDRADKCISPIPELTPSGHYHFGNTFFRISGLFQLDDTLQIRCQLPVTAGNKIPLDDNNGLQLHLIDWFGFEELVNNFDRSSIQGKNWFQTPQTQQNNVKIRVRYINPLHFPHSGEDIGGILLENVDIMTTLANKVLDSLQTNLFTTFPTIRQYLSTENPFNSIKIGDLFIDSGPSSKLNNPTHISTSFSTLSYPFSDLIKHVSLTAHSGSEFTFLIPFTSFSNDISANDFANLFVRPIPLDSFRIAISTDTTNTYRSCPLSTMLNRYKNPTWYNDKAEDVTKNDIGPYCLAILGQYCQMDSDCQIHSNLSRNEIHCVDSICSSQPLQDTSSHFLERLDKWSALRQGVSVPYSDNLEAPDATVEVFSSPYNFLSFQNIAFAKLECHYKGCNNIWRQQVLDWSIKFPCDTEAKAQDNEEHYEPGPVKSVHLNVTIFNSTFHHIFHSEENTKEVNYWVHDLEPWTDPDHIPHQTDPRLYALSPNGPIDPRLPLKFDYNLPPTEELLFTIHLTNLGVVPECPNGSIIQLYFDDKIVGNIPILPSLVPTRDLMPDRRYHPRGQFLIGPSWTPESKQPRNFLSNRFQFTLILNDLIHPWKPDSIVRILPVGLSQASGIHDFISLLECSIYGQPFPFDRIDLCIDGVTGETSTPPCLDPITQSRYIDWKLSDLNRFDFEQATMLLECGAVLDVDHHKFVAQSLRNGLFGFAIVGYEKNCGESRPDLSCSRTFVSAIENDLEFIDVDRLNSEDRLNDYLPPPIHIGSWFLRFITSTTGDLNSGDYEVITEHVYITAYEYIDPRLSPKDTPFVYPINGIPWFYNHTYFSFIVLGNSIETMQRDEDFGKLGTYHVYCEGYLPTEDKVNDLKHYPLFQGDLVLFGRSRNDLNSVRLRLESRNEFHFDAQNNIPTGTICSRYTLSIQHYFFTSPDDDPKQFHSSVTSTLEYVQDVDLSEQYLNHTSICQVRYLSPDIAVTRRTVPGTFDALSVIHWCDETIHYSKNTKDLYFGFEWDLFHGYERVYNKTTMIPSRSLELQLHKTEWTFSIDNYEPYHSPKSAKKLGLEKHFFERNDEFEEDQPEKRSLYCSNRYKDVKPDEDDLRDYPPVSATHTQCAVWRKNHLESMVMLPGRLTSANVFLIGYGNGGSDYGRFDNDIDNHFEFDLTQTYIFHCDGLFAHFTHISRADLNYDEYENDLKSPPILSATLDQFNSTYHTFIWNELAQKRQVSFAEWFSKNKAVFTAILFIILAIIIIFLTITVTLWALDKLDRISPRLSESYDHVALTLELFFCPRRLARQLHLPESELMMFEELPPSEKGSDPDHSTYYTNDSNVDDPINNELDGTSAPEYQMHTDGGNDGKNESGTVSGIIIPNGKDFVTSNNGGGEYVEMEDTHD